MKVDPKTASEIIKPRIDKWDASHPVDPMEVHREIYLHHVCKFLNLEPTPANVHRITSALAHYGIDTDNFQEYPKEVDGKVVQSKEEHDELQAKPVQDEPTQAQNDVRDEPGRDPFFAPAEPEPVRETA